MTVNARQMDSQCESNECHVVWMQQQFHVRAWKFGFLECIAVQWFQVCRQVPTGLYVTVAPACFRIQSWVVFTPSHVHLDVSVCNLFLGVFNMYIFSFHPLILYQFATFFMEFSTCAFSVSTRWIFVKLHGKQHLVGISCGVWDASQTCWAQWTMGRSLWTKQLEQTWKTCICSNYSWCCAFNGTSDRSDESVALWCWPYS